MNPQELRNLQEAYLEVVEKQQLDEANRLEKHLGMGSNTPENELSRMKRRASASGIGSEGPDGKPRQNTDPGTIRMNRGVARMVHKRNRGKSPSDPTYKKRRGIDPHTDMKSYRDSPLGLPKKHKDPLNSKSNIGNKVKVKTKPARDLWSNPHQASSKIVKFRREDLDIYDIILSHLLDEGYAETPEAAESIMVNMSEEWRDSIIG
jgi:hypothetical protein